MNSSAKVLGIFLPLIFTLMCSSMVFSKEFYCSGTMEVFKGNKYREKGKGFISFGIEIFEKKVLFYFPDGKITELSLINEGKYPETQNSVDATNNKFFINIFVSKSDTETGTDANNWGQYHKFQFDKSKKEFFYSLQSWNHYTKNDEYDSENFFYGIKGLCKNR